MGDVSLAQGWGAMIDDGASESSGFVMPRERRQFGRRETFLQGWIIAGRRSRLACIVRNVSPKGAFLELAPPVWLPFRFDLVIEVDGRRYGCEIRHTHTTGLGVNFVEAADADADKPSSRPEIDDIGDWLGAGSAGRPRSRG